LKLLKLLAFLCIVGFIVYFFYGETYQDAGLKGVQEEISNDFVQLKENPKLQAITDTVKQEITLFYNQIMNKENTDTSLENGETVEKPTLHSPEQQDFSIHNIEIGDNKSFVEGELGSSKRISMNEYGINWHTYHQNYQNFLMVAYNDKEQVIGLYTNQDLLTSSYHLTMQNNQEDVREKLGKPIEGIRKGFTIYQTAHNNEYDTYLFDQNYVTIFYDLHQENKITGIQIITESMEKRKDGFYGKASDQLRNGLEYQLFDLTNASRVVHGKPILTWIDEAQETARAHSKDMAVNQYFSHDNLRGESPFDRLTNDGISYRTAGENLASGQTSSIFAHEGLMNSSGHRKNILHNDFKQLTVGVAFDDENKPYYTENFITK
jgi:uncharacterized protein YkwD